MRNVVLEKGCIAVVNGSGSDAAEADDGLRLEGVGLSYMRRWVSVDGPAAGTRGCPQVGQFE